MGENERLTNTEGGECDDSARFISSNRTVCTAVRQTNQKCIYACTLFSNISYMHYHILIET